MTEWEAEGDYELTTVQMQLLLAAETMVIMHKLQYIVNSQEINCLTAMSVLQMQADTDQEEAHCREMLTMMHLWGPLLDQIIQPEVLEEYTNLAKAPHPYKGPMFSQF